jgi:Zn-dependent protease
MFNLSPSVLISRLLTLVIAFTVHEFAHAWSATQFGDETPRQYGRLTLNPLAHLDPMGSLLLLATGFGWAKPVPVNPYALERRAASAYMWVSLAGPLSNLLMAILAAIPFRLGLVNLRDYQIARTSFFPSPAQFLVEFIGINLVLMLFNLIPLSPLDGEKVAMYVLPPNLARPLAEVNRYGPIILLVVAVGLPIVGINPIAWVIYPTLDAILKMLLTG